jgi:Iap family predicted aminopeptidase
VNTRQKIAANIRAGQANFNRLYTNLRREEQLMNNIEKLIKERSKTVKLYYARLRGTHAEGSNANRRNTLINNRLNRNIERKTQEIRRLEAELVALRRRLMERPTRMTNQNILEGVNFSVRKAEFNRMQQKRLARLITNAYLKPGGKFSRNTVANVKRDANKR